MRQRSVRLRRNRRLRKRKRRRPKHMQRWASAEMAIDRSACSVDGMTSLTRPALLDWRTCNPRDSSSIHLTNCHLWWAWADTIESKRPRSTAVRVTTCLYFGLKGCNSKWRNLRFERKLRFRIACSRNPKQFYGAKDQTPFESSVLTDIQQL